MAKGTRGALKGKKYKVLELEKARKALAAAGLTPSQIDDPDPVEAGRILKVDTVLKVRLRGVHMAERIIFKHGAIAVDFELFDAKTGDVLWKHLGQYYLQSGWLIARFKGVQAHMLVMEAANILPKKPKKK